VWRPVVVERIAEWREDALEPSLVQHEAVGVRDRDGVERRVEASAQLGVLAEEAAEEIQGEGADRLVGMRHAGEQRRPPAVPDGQQLDRASLGRGADRLQPGEPGKGRHQGARLCPELLERQELPVVRHPRQERGEVEAGYDSSFEE